MGDYIKLYMIVQQARDRTMSITTGSASLDPAIDFGTANGVVDILLMIKIIQM
jgi:hypothetical protein